MNHFRNNGRKSEKFTDFRKKWCKLGWEKWTVPKPKPGLRPATFEVGVSNLCRTSNMACLGLSLSLTTIHFPHQTIVHLDFPLSVNFPLYHTYSQKYTGKSMIVMLWSAILKKLYTAEMGILVVWLRMIRFASIKNPVQNAKPKK